MMPSVAELTYFLEISSTLNFSTAARTLKVSQSALSRAMQNLEGNVGTELFIRHKKGVTLTAAGKRVLTQIKPLIENWHKTKLHALASHEAIEGDVRIGCHSAAGMFIHGMLADLLETYPGLNIELVHGYSDDITQKVMDLNVDLGMVTNPAPIPDLVIRELKQVTTTLWKSTGNSDIQNVTSGNAVLICGPHDKFNSSILKACQTNGLNIRRTLKVNSFEVLASLTANGCGIGILPACYVGATYGDTLKAVPNAPVMEHTLSLIYRQEYAKVKAVQVVLSAIKMWVQTNECLTKQKNASYASLCLATGSTAASGSLSA